MLTSPKEAYFVSKRNVYSVKRALYANAHEDKAHLEKEWVVQQDLVGYGDMSKRDIINKKNGQIYMYSIRREVYSFKTDVYSLKRDLYSITRFASPWGMSTTAKETHSLSKETYFL